MKIKWFVLFILVLFVFQPFSVSAHTSLKNSNPEEGAVLKENLERIRLTFDTPIEKTSTLELKTAQGQTVELEKPLIIGNELSAVLKQELETGTYRIGWKLISEDGHPVEGTIRFETRLDEAVASSVEPTEQQTATMEAEQASVVPTESTEPVQTGLVPTVLPWMVAVLVLGIIVIGLLLRRQKRS
ncbi:MULTISPECIES: copper resistance CopC family protein [Exiguobacterium]|uniref:Copper resistance protein CopC n=1 Tax=Exiguobacterium antarcticum TaxID=132920 RepID=A0ABT6R5Y9_9BACL|nr:MULTISPECIES: copper resistance CopC family protein [Exiguobacterium]MCT4779900.1 copper resistance protein CopC [Exiguobacterium soli]MDI3236374.1 copper resistance protein CopC [Exiguobacterium antarcticum]